MMSLGFLNAALLAGLAGLAIPPIIHFFNRRRHDVVPWGAMQFLEVSSARRRKFFLEELLLLAARMTVVALLVFCLATPFMQGSLADRWFRPSRDVIYVLDRSASMGRRLDDGSPWTQAVEKIKAELADLKTGDRVGLVFASEPLETAAPLGSDPDEIVRLLEAHPTPSGGCDGAAAAERAWEHLRQHGRQPDQEIVLATDLQSFGWFDAAAMTRWRRFGERLKSAEGATPRFRWLSVKPADGSDAPANVALQPIVPSRRLAAAGQNVAFAADVMRYGTAIGTVAVAFEVDGERRGEAKIALPAAGARTEVRFEHRFERSGLHRIALVLTNHKDALAADDRQDLIFEVLPELPILLVDAERSPSAASSTYFLSKAFSEPGEKNCTSAVAGVRTTADRLTPELLLPRSGDRPRVVVLSDVPELGRESAKAVETFVAEGGGLLLLVGPRMVQARDKWEALRSEGLGWIPIRIAGSVSIPAAESAKVRLDPATFVHPALALFKGQPNSSIATALHRSWAKLAPEGGATAAQFANRDSWLISHAFGKGRVLASALPMDSGWDGVLAKAWEFPVLAHELVFALADVRSDAFNLAPGQAIVVGEERIPVGAVPMLHVPGGAARPWPTLGKAGTFAAPGPAGIYRLSLGGGGDLPIVVRAEPRESLLTYADDNDVIRLEEAVPARWSGRDASGATSPPHEIWLAFLLGFLALLVFESWMTRRMVRARTAG